MIFRKRVEEKREVVKKEEIYSTAICGYDVIVVIKDNWTEISIAKIGSLGMGILKFHPKTASDVEQFAKISENLFIELAASLRESGLEDMRSDWDRCEDAQRERVAELRATGNL